MIGYGGIVHIDWVNLRGEVSFLLETSRTYDHQNYARELNIFFSLLKELAFKFLKLEKLTTESYANRPFHIEAIENSGFLREGVLRQHVLLDGNWVDAILASCLRNEHEENL